MKSPLVIAALSACLSLTACGGGGDFNDCAAAQTNNVCDDTAAPAPAEQAPPQAQPPLRRGLLPKPTREQSL